MPSERDVTLSAARDRNVLQRLAPDPLASDRASPVALRPEPSVPVLVSGVRLLLPERVLRAAASRLQTATGGYVALEDYAEAVALTLSALKTDGLVEVLRP